MTANRDALTGLANTVHTIESAVDSAVTLISGLVNRLAAALMGNDLAGDITSLRDELDSAKERLAAAVAANTLAEDDSDTIDGSTPESVEVTDSGEVTAGDNDGTDAPADDTGADESVPADETEAAGDGDEVSGDTSTLPTGDDVVNANNSDDTDSSNENGNTAA